MDTEKSTSESFASLAVEHEELLELFLVHQEALLEGDLEEARKRLAAFEDFLRGHIRMEEEILMPLYRRGGEIAGGAPEFFEKEHAKLLEYVEKFHTRLEEMDPGALDFKREILALLDEERGLKNLMEHHDLREENLFFPTLDKVTSPEEKVRYIKKCRHRDF